MEISLLKCPEIGTFKVGFVALFLDAPSCFINLAVCPILFTRRTHIRARDEVLLHTEMKFTKRINDRVRYQVFHNVIKIVQSTIPYNER